MLVAFKAKANGTAGLKTRPDESRMKAYLMVYHKDEDHGLHFAVSRDGRQFKALNDDNPVIAGDTIATQKGIRDPHIYRGPDGAFYMAMTDLHVFGQRDGKRDTEWERPGKTYGWGNNKGIVMMKSRDLIHWTHHVVHFDKLFTSWQEIGCAWAPETIFDEQAEPRCARLFFSRHEDMEEGWRGSRLADRRDVGKRETVGTLHHRA